MGLLLLSVYTLGWIFLASYLTSKAWHLGKSRDEGRQRLADLERMKAKIAGMKDKLEQLLNEEEQSTSIQ